MTNGVVASDVGSLKVADSLITGVGYDGVYVTSYANDTAVTLVNDTIVGYQNSTGISSISLGAGHFANVSVENTAILGVVTSLRRKAFAGGAFLTISHSAFDASQVHDEGFGTLDMSDANIGTPSGLDGGYAFVKGDVSSQFLSGLLMALPYAQGVTTVEVQGPLVSKPYVAMTLAVMEAFGVRAGNRKNRRFDVRPARYTGRAYAIEPDASAASYFFALAANRPATTTVTGGRLRGVDVDMNAISDTVMTLAVVSLFAEGITRIRNVAHIRHKETDRIAALATELRKLGATVDEHPDGLVIIPPPRLSPAAIATYDDHRMAMAFALAGLKAEGVTILDPGCVAKTYPGFWDDLAALSS